MPRYNDLRPVGDENHRDFELVFPDLTVEDKKRTIRNLLRLRGGLDAIAPRKADHNLLLASWNIKEFGHTTQRLPESYFYLAEVMSRFDLVAVQEVKSTLKDLLILMRLLGEDWAYLVNDITEGKDGNSERSAYLYNRRRVELAGLAGELVLWDDLLEGATIRQLKRTPYLTGFRAGWKTFALLNMHLHPGEGDDDFPVRAEEVRLLLAALADKKRRGRLWSENLILTGDFNFYAPTATDPRDAPAIARIEAAGYREVESLKGVDTNASLTESYDRLFIGDSEYFPVAMNGPNESGGVFRVFDHVFRDGDHADYADVMKAQYTGDKNLDEGDNLEKYFKHPWRKNQLSDHFPIWIELIVDSSDRFLADKLAAL